MGGLPNSACVCLPCVPPEWESIRVHKQVEASAGTDGVVCLASRHLCVATRGTRRQQLVYARGGGRQSMAVWMRAAQSCVQCTAISKLAFMNG